MRTRRMAILLAAAAVTSGVGATGASAATITFDVPVNGPVLNTCTGETVFINGTQHFKVTDNSTLGGLKSQIATHLTGVKGVTAAGVRYVMNDQTSDMQHAEFAPFGNAQMTVENTTNLTRQREEAGLLMEDGTLVTGDDSRLHILAHLTVSNGVTRAEKTDLRFDCR